MLTEIVLRNYRCFRDATVRLTPLTVVVGPNGVGKSAFLRALDPRRNVARVDDYWMKQAGQLVIVRRLGEGGGDDSGPLGGGYTFQISGGGYPFSLLQLDVAALRHANTAQHATALETNGGNLTNVFASLTRKEQQALVAQFCALVPMFQDVDTIPTDAGNLRLRFQDRWQNDVWYAPEDVSDGTMLILAYLTLQYGMQADGLIAIEEPERAVHPYLLGEIISFLRRLSRGEIGGRRLQVVLATHSAELLNHVEPEEVRFFSRHRETGAVRVEEAPVNDPEWKNVFQDYRDSLAAAWLAGGLGGVPGR